MATTSTPAPRRPRVVNGRVRYPLRIRTALYDQLVELAAAEGRSLNAQLETILTGATSRTRRR